MIRLGVMVSGRGSNLRALYDAIARGEVSASIVAVVADRYHTPAIEWARSAHLPVWEGSPKDWDDKTAFESDIHRFLISQGVEWVVLAGYMRLVGPHLLGAYASRILNIHPSLLPLFKGLHPQQQALAAGATQSGCTVHLVTEALDDGPVLGQSVVPVLPGDTVDTLSARILDAEHRLLPHVIQRLANGSLSWIE
ncbi:phosphoribosylglycinamide formyltransferase [bacterium]|nr:phosphoribosylglycinamide formyltransferase [bacterium]